MLYKINPFPAVRTNGKGGRFTPRAKKYHDKLNELRKIIGKDKIELIKKIISGDYEIVFVMKMGDSWSKKRKENYENKPHRQSPDIDNIYKAFIDCIFYDTDYNDRDIFKIKCSKIWGYEGSIIIN